MQRVAAQEYEPVPAKTEMVSLFNVSDESRLQSAQAQAVDAMRDLVSRVKDPAFQDAIVKSRKRSAYWGGWMAFSEFIVTIATIAWLVAMIVFLATNKYNVRFDYNTNYFDRDSCSAHGDHVCQEVTFGPMHAVNVSWVTLSTLIAILISEITVVMTAKVLHNSNLCNDMDMAFNDILALDDSSRTGVGLLSFLVSPFRFLGRASYNQLTTWYNVRHVILDAALVLLVFTSFGVRYDTKLLFLMGLAVLWNFLIVGAQQENYRTKPFLTALNYLQANIGQFPSLLNGKVGAYDLLRWAEARWLLPVMQAVIGGFLFSLITVYFAKFPYHSRHWYHYFAAIVLLINIGLRSLFNLFRYTCYDARLRDMPTIKMSAFGQCLSTFVRGVAGLGSLLCFSPTIIQIVLTLYDVLGLFTFWVILHGCEGHSNIARIVWPTALSIVY